LAAQALAASLPAKAGNPVFPEVGDEQGVTFKSLHFHFRRSRVLDCPLSPQ
jgi:hypothetical protein